MAHRLLGSIPHPSGSMGSSVGGGDAANYDTGGDPPKGAPPKPDDDSPVYEGTNILKPGAKPSNEPITHNEHQVNSIIAPPQVGMSGSTIHDPQQDVYMKPYQAHAAKPDEPFRTTGIGGGDTTTYNEQLAEARRQHPTINRVSAGGAERDVSTPLPDMGEAERLQAARKLSGQEIPPGENMAPVREESR